MGHVRYDSKEDVLNGLISGYLTMRSASQMIQYYKRKEDYDRAKMFKFGMVEYEYYLLKNQITES